MVGRKDAEIERGKRRRAKGGIEEGTWMRRRKSKGEGGKRKEYRGSWNEGKE